MARKSSKKMGGTASAIMQTAKQGGPIEQNRAILNDEIKSAFATAITNSDLDPEKYSAICGCDMTDHLVGIFAKALKPFIDDAESLAASVLSQVEPK